MDYHFRRTDNNLFAVRTLVRNSLADACFFQFRNVSYEFFIVINKRIQGVEEKITEAAKQQIEVEDDHYSGA